MATYKGVQFFRGHGVYSCSFHLTSLVSGVTADWAKSPKRELLGKTGADLSRYYAMNVIHPAVLKH